MTTKTLLYCGAALAAFAAIAAPAVADISTMSEWDGTEHINTFGVPNTATYGQTITATTLNSRLTSFTFELAHAYDGAAQYQAYVYQWTGSGITGSALYTSAILTGSSTSGYTAVTINTGGIMLTPGQQYVLFLTTSSITGQSDAAYSWGGINYSTYTDGDFVYMNNGTNFSLLSTSTWITWSNYDLAFTAALTPSSIVALLPSGTGVNPTNVATGIDTAVLDNGNTLPDGMLALYGLSGSDLTDALAQASGELGADLGLAGRAVLRPFFDAALGRFADGSYEMPLGKSYRLWSMMLGGQSDVDGDAAVVSHDVRSQTGGIIAGFDYAVTPNAVIGGAVAWQRSDLTTRGGLGNAGGGSFQMGAYGDLRFADAAYLSGIVGASFGQLKTYRVVTISGTDVLTAKEDIRSVGGRLEGGYRFQVNSYDLTPYAAVQIESYTLPGYAETAISGSSDFALTYEARGNDNWRTELGITAGRNFAINDTRSLRLTLRTAWVYDDNASQFVHAAFSSLADSDFVVNGPTLNKSAALLSVGLRTFNSGPLSFGAKFSGQFGQNARTYSGSLTFNYAL